MHTKAPDDKRRGNCNRKENHIPRSELYQHFAGGETTGQQFKEVEGPYAPSKVLKKSYETVQPQDLDPHI